MRCLFNILAMIDSSFQQAADILDIIARIIFCIVSGCMYAQQQHELDPETGAPGSGGVAPVADAGMKRDDDDDAK